LHIVRPDQGKRRTEVKRQFRQRLTLPVNVSLRTDNAVIRLRVSRTQFVNLWQTITPFSLLF
jgi:hypothetical protein